MKELRLSKGSFDYEARFKVEGVRGDVSLMRDYKVYGDGIYWGMQHEIALQSSYSDKQVKHIERMRRETLIQNGEIVLIDGKQYRANVKGDYSDCAIFEPVIV